MSLGFEDCKVFVSNVDSQGSAEGGIVVQVIGEMSNRGGAWRKFSQTFFLAQQPNGYFVLNDMFRYMKEEGDDADEALAAPAPDTPPPALTESIPVAALGSEAPASIAADAGLADFTAHGEPATTSVPPPTEPAAMPHINGVSSEALPSLASAHSFGDAAAVAPIEAPSPGDGATDAGEMPQTQAETADTPAVAPANEEDTQLAQAEQTTHAEAPVQEQQVEDPSAVDDPAVSAAPNGEAHQASPETHTAAPTTSAPPAPKTWANLAAANRPKWGTSALSEARGLSAKVPASDTGAAATSTAAPSTSTSSDKPASAAGASMRTSNNSNSGPATGHSAIAQLAVPSCFLKGVVETVPEKALRDALAKFGPIKSLDMVRSKACAFLEYERLDSAKRALQTGLRQSEGGEGGLYIGSDRIMILPKRSQSERAAGVGGGSSSASGGGTRRSGSSSGAEKGAASQSKGQRSSQGQGQTKATSSTGKNASQGQQASSGQARAGK